MLAFAGGTVPNVHEQCMRVLVPATGLYTYPDVSVVCGPLAVLLMQQDHDLINPT